MCSCTLSTDAFLSPVFLCYWATAEELTSRTLVFLEGTKEEGGLEIAWRMWHLSAAGIGREWVREESVC